MKIQLPKIFSYSCINRTILPCLSCKKKLGSHTP